MKKLVALKRLRYPRGPDGKEYNVGDSFEAMSDRDFKALTLVRAARPGDQPGPLRVAEPRQASSVQTAALTTDESASATPSRRRYRRTDMQPED